MADIKKNIAASVRQRLLDLTRQNQDDFGIVLVAYALERLVYRLSISDYAESFILKGGMLITLWIEDQKRFTRDIDFLSFGLNDETELVDIFSEILSIEGNDGCIFDSAALTAKQIRNDQVYAGIRLKTFAYLDTAKIPITIDIGFGDAVTDPEFTVEYPSLLDLPAAKIRAYSPATVIAEKFQAIVALGIINGRMKDFYDIWAIPKSQKITEMELLAAITSTFQRRETEIPNQRPEGLSVDFTTDSQKSTQWLAYANSIELDAIPLKEIADQIWRYLEPICKLANSPQNSS